MKRLFVSVMVIGGFTLVGMQAAESAPMGSGKVRPDNRLRRCDKIRNPEKRAECRAKARTRLERERRGGGGRMKADRARNRCTNLFENLEERAACCAKIRPASRLSPKKKKCRPIAPRAKAKVARTRCDKIRNPEKRAECRAKAKTRLERERRGGGGRMKAQRARMRCSKMFENLEERAACCAKIRPASRLGRKKKLCKPIAPRAKAN